MIDRFSAFAPLFDAFAAAGHTIWFVGGCVRDIVMGLDKVGDVDLATDARPEQTKAVLAAGGFKAFPIGERFGTITTLVDGATVEITTFRVDEVYARASRHPEVRFGTDLRADLARRDLSINAMAMGANGSIVDPFDGQRAIGQRLLEVPGGGFDNTVSILRDDPLRLLRIARFAARFGYAPTAPTTDAARVCAPELAHISNERWKAELDKLWVGKSIETGLRWFAGVGGLGVLHPDAAAAAPEALDTLVRRLVAAPREPLACWTVWVDWAADEAAAALAGVAGEEPAACSASATEPAAWVGWFAERFRFSNRERKLVGALLAQSRRVDADLGADSRHARGGGGGAVGALTDARLRRVFVAVPDAWEQVYAVVAARRFDDDAVGVAARDAEARTRALLADGDPTPRLPPQFGTYAARALGLAGPDIGRAVTAVLDAMLDGHLANGADADGCVAYLRAHGFAAT